MNTILDNPDSNIMVSDMPPAKALKHVCGTIGCIAGWASIYPRFVRQGIRQRPYSEMTCAERFFDMPGHVFKEVFHASSAKMGSRGRVHKKIALARIAEAIKNYKNRWKL